MRVIFAGTPDFATAALEALHEAGHDIILVLTQPDRPAGRGMKLTESATGQMAGKLGLPVAKPLTLKDPGAQQQLRDLAPEVMVVAAYGLLLPQAVLDIPRHGCLNIHGSLLPRWRGAAPVQRAILAGDSETGIGIMQMEAGLDTGPVLLEKKIPIASDDTAATLFAKLTGLGAEAIVEALRDLPGLTARPQSAEGVTYAHKLSRQESQLDWTQSAEQLARQIRAFDPFPGSETRHRGEALKIWQATPEVLQTGSLQGAPGTLLAVEKQGPLVACGQGALRLELIQKPGGRRMPATDWARVAALTSGEVLGSGSGML
jgi:methionyl-tRNA formyltransferase